MSETTGTGEPRHIAVLVTNTDWSAFAAKHPRDGEKFTTLLQPLRPQWRFTAVEVAMGDFPKSVEDFDGYVITGSPSSVNDREDWIDQLMALIVELDRKRKPTVGCCFGHQAIAKALGGEVVKHPGGWGLGTAVTAFERHEPWMAPRRDTIQLFAAHQDQVSRLPAGAVSLGGSAFCRHGSFRVGTHMFTTQYHPEMTLEFITAMLVEMEKYLDAGTLAKARETLRTPAESNVFAEWMLRFLEIPRVAQVS
jgi:GMP synthase-like glutamine amidotransferase